MNDREVADYLLANPDFFVEHAELLATIKLGNPHGKAAVSLQERQMEMLREKNKHLELRLSELLRYGHENDSISAKTVHWVSHVLAERDPHALPRLIAEQLRQEFDVPQVALRLWDVADAYAQASFAKHTGEEVRIFANSLEVPYCGANTGFEAAQWLDGGSGGNGAEGAERAERADNAAQSVAIITLRKRVSAEERAPSGEAFGLLVLGSPDPRRFHDGMATDLLRKIGTLASAGLTRLLPH